jgi:hypothetical protein
MAQVYREFDERGHWVAFADLIDQRLEQEQAKEWWQFKYNNDAWKLTIIQNLLYGTLYTPRSKFLNKEAKYNFNERWVEMPDYDRRSTILTKKQAVHSLLVRPGYHKDFEWYFFLYKEYAHKYEEWGNNRNRPKELNYLLAALIWFFIQTAYEILEDDHYEEFGASKYFRIISWPDFWLRMQFILFGIFREDLEATDSTINENQASFSKHRNILYNYFQWTKKKELLFFKKMFAHEHFFWFTAVKNTTTRYYLRIRRRQKRLTKYFLRRFKRFKNKLKKKPKN